MSKALEKPTFSLAPNSLAEAMEFAKVIADSEFVPKDLRGKPGSILVCVQMGMELGLPPMQSLQGIACINGRPAIWGDTLLALVRASPHFEAIHEEQNDQGAICTVKRRGEPARTMAFTVEDARRAGLWQTEAKVKRRSKEGGWYETENDSPWYRYPRRMMQMRARAFALRDVFADTLKGISVAEEARDLPDRSRDIEGTAEPDLNARLKALVDSRPEEAPPIREKSIEEKAAVARPTVQKTEPVHRPAVLADVLALIAAAKTREDLEKITAPAKALPEADIETARNAYTARLKIICPTEQD